jgi:NifU-like protein involved in Fe-S cluster formation
MELQMRINSEAKVIEETESKTFGCGSATGGSSLPAELVTGKSSRKRWPSRTRISSARSAFPATLLDATGYSGIGRRLHLVGNPIL